MLSGKDAQCCAPVAVTLRAERVLHACNEWRIRKWGNQVGQRQQWQLREQQQQ